MTTQQPVAVRFWAKVEKTETCWLWTGARSSGYGRFRVGGRIIYAHRWSYEQVHGPIPDGLEIDHLCRVRHCVNPADLEVVTSRENTLRGYGITSFHAQQTHCKRGHLFDKDNTYNPSPGRQAASRACRICRPARYRENYRLASVEAGAHR